MSKAPSADATWVLVLVFGIAVLEYGLHVPDSSTPHGFVAVLILLGAPLVWIIARGLRPIGPGLRRLISVYFGFLVAASVANAFMLLASVVRNSAEAPVLLLFAGFDVMAINMLTFGIIYWWLDTADPAIQQAGGQESPDFMFPQQMGAGSTWRPALMDYIYVAYTNLLAFSPTDTMPLRIRTKVLFMTQSAVSTFCAVIILGHAINSLPS